MVGQPSDVTGPLYARLYDTHQLFLPVACFLLHLFTRPLNARPCASTASFLLRAPLILIFRLLYLGMQDFTHQVFVLL